MDQRELRTMLTDLHVLAELGRSGTVTAAADELGIPQPTASRALGRLAARTAVPLTTRRGRSLALTEAGRDLAEASADAFTRLEDALAATRRSAGAQHALIDVAYQTALGESFLPQALTRYRARHPTVRFRLLHGARARCLEMVRDAETDIAVVADALREPGLRSTTLYSEPLYLVVGLRHPLAGSDAPVRPEDIDPAELISLSAGYGLHDSVRRILGAEVVPSRAFEVDDYRAARGLAAAGAGVSILPASATGAADDAVELPIDHPAAQRTVTALTRPDPDPITDDLLRALRVTARSRWRPRG